jgi:hypothetical protein
MDSVVEVENDVLVSRIKPCPSPYVNRLAGWQFARAQGPARNSLPEMAFAPSQTIEPALSRLE